jgi:iron complex outermembrane receptor protein
VGVKGFGRAGDYNSRILILIDGHKINENVFGSAAIGTDFPVDLDLVDRVEIIRGPNYSLYGSSAFFGVINVVTRTGMNLKGPEISGEIGGFETYKGRISYGNQFANGVDLLFSGAYFKSNGPRHLYFKEFDTPATNFGIAENCDDDRFGDLLLKLSYHDLTLEGIYHSREKGIPTASFETVFNSPQNRTVDEQVFLDLKYQL